MAAVARCKEDWRGIAQQSLHANMGVWLHARIGNIIEIEHESGRDVRGNARNFRHLWCGLAHRPLRLHWW